MVLSYFNNNISLLPTPEQVLFGIILAQISLINTNNLESKVNFKGLAKIYAATWRSIFSMIKSVDMQKPLTPKILSNPDH